MPARSRRLAAFAAALVLAAPGSALAQSAGDEQYEDPFAPGQGQEQEPAPEPAPAPAPAPAPDAAPAPGAAPAPEAPAPTPAPAAQPAAAGEQLPYTGAETALVALGGALLLAGGVVLRVRLREQR
jgi:LPXTG-motif cell wall-anchored protein